ncbi:MAG: CinA family protein [Burkholderiaceae bacterium]
MRELIALAGQIAAVLETRGQTLAVSESSTGGLVSAALLAVPGASAYYLGGAVVYTRRARALLLDIPRAALDGIRSASEPYALLCARTVRSRFEADWGLAETGAAGPKGNVYGDPPGHSCIAVVGPAGARKGAPVVEHALTMATGDTDRVANMNAFAQAALESLLRRLRAE